MTNEEKKMIEDFQCPGCVHGCDITCERFKFDKGEWGFHCCNHTPGTVIIPVVGTVYLGLPKGFNRVNPIDRQSTKIRLHTNAKGFKPDKFNIAVWAIEKDGYSFVRIYCPRIDMSWINIHKATLKQLNCEQLVGCYNVATFIDEID